MTSESQKQQCPIVATTLIVAITAHAMIDEKAKSFDAGCDDFLVKPINKQRLLEVLETYAHQ